MQKDDFNNTTCFFGAVVGHVPTLPLYKIRRNTIIYQGRNPYINQSEACITAGPAYPKSMKN
jgi:hypothetical protein